MACTRVQLFVCRRWSRVSIVSHVSMHVYVNCLCEARIVISELMAATKCYTIWLRLALHMHILIVPSFYVMTSSC